ncbi:hypothetical protein MMC17_004495 [Xylographa soralifera]|nr:hypothetical protein [Xylographa soralifera]
MIIDERVATTALSPNDYGLHNEVPVVSRQDGRYLNTIVYAYTDQESLASRSHIHELPSFDQDAAQSRDTGLETATEDSPWERLNLLSIDGGGIRGLSSLLILSELMKRIEGLEHLVEPRATASTDSPLIEPGRMKAGRAKFPTQTRSSSDFRPCHYFDYIAGTSTGGLIAIMLGRLRMSVDDAITVYTELESKVFVRPRKLRSWSPFKSHSREAILRSVNKKLRPAQSSPNEKSEVFESDATRCRTIVCSVQRGSNKGIRTPYLFRSYAHYGEDDQVLERNSGRAATFDLSKIVYITAGFGSAYMGKYKYYDAAASLSNPSLELYREVEMLHRQAHYPVDIFLSLGCGNTKKSPYYVTKRKKGLSTRMSGETLMTVSDAVHELMLKESERFSYYRLDVREPIGYSTEEDSDSKESVYHTVERIRTATLQYLRRPEIQSMITECAESLVERRRQRSETMRWESFALGTRYRCKFEGCDHKDSSGNESIFQDRNELTDHLRTYHEMPPPDANNYQDIKSLLDKGRTDSD